MRSSAFRAICSSVEKIGSYCLPIQPEGIVLLSFPPAAVFVPKGCKIDLNKRDDILLPRLFEAAWRRRCRRRLSPVLPIHADGIPRHLLRVRKSLPLRIYVKIRNGNENIFFSCR